jgi:hypothetical protein
MVRQAQKVSGLQQSEGILGEGSLRGSKKENGWGWLSRIATFFKSLGRPRVDNQVREEVVRNRRTVLAKKSNTSTKPSRVRSNDTSKASRKSPRKAVCAAASKNKAKGKVLPKG